MAQYRK